MWSDFSLVHQQYLSFVESEFHGFRYSASGATITAKCVATGCDLPPSTEDGTDHVAKLTINAPLHTAVGDGKSTVATITDLNSIQGDAKVKYQTKTDDTWSDETEDAPTVAGKHKASITLGTGTNSATAYVEYEITNPDYNVTVTDGIEHGTLTANPTTAKYGAPITLTATPSDGYGLKSITVTKEGGGTVDVTNNTFTFTMPAENVTASAEFAELTPYTVFYKTDDSVTAVKCKIDGTEYDMTKNASLGSTACWALRVQAVEGKEKFSLSFSTDGGSPWTGAVDKTPQIDIHNDLDNGGSAVIKGDTNAFILALSKGTEIVSANDETGEISPVEGSKFDFYLVTPNTPNISIPNPQRDGYEFKSWEYTKTTTTPATPATTVTIPAGNDSTSIPVSGQITESTILSAVWEQINLNVTFTGVDGIAGQTLNYAAKATKPADPTNAGYALVGWALAEKSVQRVTDGDTEQDRLLGVGSLFDFENTKVISDLTLKPVWKHVHSYARRQLTDFSALSAYHSYNSYFHVRLCTSGCGEVKLEPHSLNSLGRCECGYIGENGTTFVTPYTEGNKSGTQYLVRKNSEFTLFAPLSKGEKQFSKWQYRFNDTGNWKDLSAYNSTGIIVPADIGVNATYKDLTKPDLYLHSFLNNGHLYFQFEYTLPAGWTAQDAYILSGNNYMLRYMKWKENGAMDVRFAYETKNAIEVFGKKKTRNNMLSGKAFTINGYSDLRITRSGNVGKSGTIQDGYHQDDINREDGNWYFYALGVVRCKDKAGKTKLLVTDPIWASQNSQDDHYASLEN